MNEWTAVIGIAGTLLGVLITNLFTLRSKRLDIERSELEREHELDDKTRDEVLRDCVVVLTYFQRTVSEVVHGNENFDDDPAKDSAALSEAVQRMRLTAPQSIVELMSATQSTLLAARKSQALNGVADPVLSSMFVEAVEVYVQGVRLFYVNGGPHERDQAMKRIEEFSANRRSLATLRAQQKAPTPTEPASTPTHPTPAE